MTATLGSANVSRATLRIPRYGVPMADVWLTDDTVLTIGSQQALTVGNLSLAGAIDHGSDFGGQAGYTWLAGNGKWSTSVASQPYHDANGIMLSTVAADLAADAGEVGIVMQTPDRIIGFSWTRPSGVARDLLDALTGGGGGTQGQWWLDATGLTNIGPRPATATTSTTLTLDYDPALRLAHGELADDSLAGILPGTTLTAQGLATPIGIVTTVVHVDDAMISVDIYSETTGPELLRAVVDALTAWRAYLRHNPMTVAAQNADGTVAVQPYGAIDAAAPDAPALNHMAGIPGASYVLAVGAGVGVVCLAGDPGSPTVFGHLPGMLPVSVSLDASSEYDIGASASAVKLAGATPVATSPTVAAAQRRVACYGDLVTVGTQTGPLTLAGSTCSKVSA